MSVELPVSVINGRFTVSEKPLVAPGKCACCGAVDRPVVDFKFDVEFYGTVLLCGDCIREALGVHDTMFPPVEEVQTQVVPLPTIDAGELHEHLVAVRDAITDLDRSLPASFYVSETTETELTGTAEFNPDVHGEPTKANDPLFKLTDESGPNDDAGTEHSIFN